MSVQESSNLSAKINFQTQAEHMLFNTTLITEMALDLKDKCTAAEKYVSNLRSFAIRACKNVNSVQNSCKSFLLLAQKLTQSGAKLAESFPINDQKNFALKFEFEKLLSVIEKELLETEDCEVNNDNLQGQNSQEVSLKLAAEKIKILEERQRLNDSCLHSTNSTKSFKSDVDEKYPEKWTKDVVMDLDNVVNLPSVPEDIFMTSTKAKRTSSLSSLKNLRKVKLFLQRTESLSDEEEDRDEWEYQNISRLGTGDTDDKDLDIRNLSPSKTTSQLGDIQEEV